MLSNWFDNELDDYQQALVLLILVGCGWYLWGVLSEWDKLEGIYRYVAFFYYSFVVWPLSGNAEIWDFIQNLTGHNNLNFVLGLVSCFFYSCFIFGLYLIVATLIDGIAGRGVARAIFFLPALLLIPWSIIAWLFS